MNWHLIFKIASGIVVVPVALLSNKLYPWWEQSSLPVKILTGPIILPLAGIAYATSFWWNEF
jgi:hypothetical protein